MQTVSLVLLAIATTAVLAGGFFLYKSHVNALVTGAEASASGDIPLEPVGDIDTSLPGDPVAGEAIYSSVCFACHGTDGLGNGGIGGDFVNTNILQQDNSVLLNSVTNGLERNGRIMPAQGTIYTEEELRNAIAYVRQAFGRQ